MSTVETDSTLTNAEYHAHEAISNSKLKVFRKSRKLYFEQFVRKSLCVPTSPAMQLGSIVHAIALEPDRVSELYAVAPECDRRTKDGKATWQAFVETTPDSVEVVKAEVFEQAREISTALLRNQVVKQLLTLDGPTEHPVFWTDQITGLPCRGKFDKLCRDGLIVDLKTTQAATPDDFVRAIVNYGYDCQAAWYCEGYRRLFGESPDFVFIAVQTEPPYEVGLFDLTPDDLRRAKELNDRTMDALAFCQANDAWEAKHETEIVTVSLPKYAQYRDQYQTY